MEAVENASRWLAWRLRHMFNRPRRTMAPLLWKPPVAMNPPSEEFVNKLGPKKRERLEFIQREIQMMSRLSTLFPHKLNDEAWATFLRCETRKQRLDHLIFLRKREVYKEREKAAREEKKQTEPTEIKERDPEKHYLNWNVIRVEKEEKLQSWNKVANSYRLRETPSLAVDCRFLGKLSPRAAHLTGQQLQYLVTENRNLSTPWPIYYVNFHENAPNVPILKRKYLALMDSPWTSGPVVTKQNYTSLFPKEKIIYLSPHAEEELTDLGDEDVLYVMGGIVDRVPEKGIHPHASRVTAEKDGVRCARLPLDQHVKWKSGTKYLTLLAVAQILNEVHASGGDWAAAFAKHIPVRNTRAASEKNQISREKHDRIREFNYQLLALVDKRLPQR